MPHLSELHGAATHLAVAAIPLYALLLILRRMGRGGPAASAWEPWALGAAALGIAASGVTGLLVKGQSATELRGSDYDIGSIHFWLGIALALGVALLIMRRRLGGAGWPAIAVLVAVAVLVQGYLGGRMTFEDGIGVQALGQAAQTARGASALHVALAQRTAPATAGRAAFMTTGLGCAGCHGDRAQGDRGPRLAGGRELERFREVHGDGLFPRSVVTDRDFAAIDAYLRTLGRAGGRDVN